MIVSTSSELLDSINQNESKEESKHHREGINQRIDDIILTYEDFVNGSIVNKVEAIKNDDFLKGKHTFTAKLLESETESFQNEPHLIQQQGKQFPKVFKEQSYVQVRGTKYGQTATKTLKQVKSEKQYDQIDILGQSPQQKPDKQVSLMKMARKLKQVQKSNKILKQEIQQLHIKHKENRKKIEQQCQDSAKYQLQSLQAELNLEKLRSENQKDEYQRKIRHFEQKIKKDEKTKAKENKHYHLQKGNEEEELALLKKEANIYLLEREELLEKIKNLNIKNEQHQNLTHQKATKKGDQKINHKFQEQIQEKQQIIRVLSKQNEKLRQNIADLQLSLKNQKQIIQKMESQAKRITKMKEDSDAHNVRISKQNDKLKKNNENLQKQRQQISKKNVNLQKQLYNKNESIENFKKKCQEDIQKLKVIKQELNDKEKQIKKQKDEKQSLSEQMDRLSTELEDHKIVNKQLYTFKKLVMNQLSAICSRIQLPKPPANLSKEYFEQLGFGLLNIKQFPDSIILRNLNIRKKDFLVNTLCTFLDSYSFETSLIYRYDALNPTNFHQYIDRRQNLLVIVELTNGTFLAGFSINAIDQQNTVRPGRGLLISLTDQKAYKMRADPRLPVVSYDNYYFILGNAQIRIRTQQKKVFSNFGIANSTFDNGKDLRTDFLKVRESSNNQLEINTYEFYQLRVDQ